MRILLLINVTFIYCLLYSTASKCDCFVALYKVSTTAAPRGWAFRFAEWLAPFSPDDVPHAGPDLVRPFQRSEEPERVWTSHVFFGAGLATRRQVWWNFRVKEPCMLSCSCCGDCDQMSVLESSGLAAFSLPVMRKNHPPIPEGEVLYISCTHI